MDGIDLITKIVGNTIGIDLMSVTPMTDEELKQWNENQKMERDKWEEEHPEQIFFTLFKFFKKRQPSARNRQNKTISRIGEHHTEENIIKQGHDRVWIHVVI